jgi:hypothetical protein
VKRSTTDFSQRNQMKSSAAEPVTGKASRGKQQQQSDGLVPKIQVMDSASSNQRSLLEITQPKDFSQRNPGSYTDDQQQQSPWSRAAADGDRSLTNSSSSCRGAAVGGHSSEAERRRLIVGGRSSEVNRQRLIVGGQSSEADRRRSVVGRRASEVVRRRSVDTPGSRVEQGKGL